MEKRFPSTYCKAYLTCICIYIPEIPITSETVMTHLSDDLFILCFRQTKKSVKNLGCHDFRDFHCHVSRIAIIKQRGNGKHSKRKSQKTTQLLQEDFSVSSALTPPNMQTTVMQALLSSSHVPNSRMSWTRPGHYLSLREDRFSTEVKEGSWTTGGAGCSNEAAEWDSLLGGSELTSSLEAAELPKPFPRVDLAWKVPHQTKIYYENQDVQFSCFCLSNRKVKDCTFIQEYLSAEERTRTLISYKNPWSKINQVSEESVGN